MNSSFNPVTHRERMLTGMLKLSGYIDDVARHMIALAKLRGRTSTVVCSYCGVELHACCNCSVVEIRTLFERQCYQRLWAKRSSVFA